jgi:hypothetical protein
MPRPTLYARRQIHGPTSLYTDKEATKLFCYFANHHPKRPRHGTKNIWLDCFRWRLEWLPDAPETSEMPTA